MKRTKAVLMVILMCVYYFLNCEVSIHAVMMTEVASTTKQDKSMEKRKGKFKVNKNVEIKKSSKRRNYLVVAGTKSKVNNVNNRFNNAEKISKTSEGLSHENQVTAVSMTGEEALALQDESGILRVEENVMVKGSTKDIKNRKIIKKKMNKNDAEWNMQITFRAKKNCSLYFQTSLDMELVWQVLLEH